MANVKSLLNDLVRVDGISAAVVVGRDGFVIEGQTNGSRLDMEAVGAVISTGIGSAEVMGEALNVGEMSLGMVEYKDGIIVMDILGKKAVLAVVADAEAKLGNVRYQIKQRAPEIERAL